MIINSLTTIGTTVYVGANAGVFTSPVDALAWTPANIGYTGSVNAVAVFNNKLIAGTQEDGIIKSNSLSAVSWVKTNTGLNNLKTFALLNKKLLVIVATNKGLYLSTDLAANYAPSNLGLTDSLHVTSLACLLQTIAATQFGGVFMSADTGKTWVAINTGLTSCLLPTWPLSESASASCNYQRGGIHEVAQRLELDGDHRFARWSRNRRQWPPKDNIHV